MFNTKKKILRIVLILLCISAPSVVNGQGSSGFPENISDRFINYCRSFPWEEIYIQTDRDEYISGEDLWMKIYLIDRQTNTPVEGTSLAYFEVLNSQNRPVVQKKVRLIKGSGPGEVVLPDSLSTGVYIIRAYTNRMKNFLPENCFHKKIKIYNALTNRNFNGIFKDLELAGSSVPEELKIAGRDKNIKLETFRSMSGDLSLVLKTNPDFRSVNGRLLYILIQTHGNINYKGSLDLTGDSVVKSIPGSMLLPGINQVVIFNQKGDLLLEKYCYTGSDISDKITVLSDSTFKRRDKVSLLVEMSNLQSKGKDPATLSISVAESTEDIPGNIKDYMIFGSEFGSIPDSIFNHGLERYSQAEVDNYLSKLKSNWIKWDRILSGTTPSLKFLSETFFHYLTGRLVERNPSGNLGGRNIFLSVPGKKATFRYATTEDDGSFKFILPVNEELRSLIIQPEVIDGNININIETPFSEAYNRLIPLTGKFDREFLDMVSRQAANYQVEKIYDMGETSENQSNIIFSAGAYRFYGKPDIEIIMDDYIKLPVMPEVFFELLPGVTLKGRKSNYEITIADPVDGKFYDKPPVLFIDGVVINDASIIANLDPEVVEEIDAVKDRYLIGDYLFYGLVNVITRAGDFVSNVDIPQYAVRIPYRVVDQTRPFKAPDYSDSRSRQSHLPDFRNTLYWNPDVSTDKEGKAVVDFWASDYATDYVINIQSVTEDGRLISYKKKIHIE